MYRASEGKQKAPGGVGAPTRAGQTVDKYDDITMVEAPSTTLGEPEAKPTPPQRVKSAADLEKVEFPDIPYWWGGLLRTGSRLAIIGEPKTAKSFFALQLGLHMANGTQFLGMDTKPAVVLYVNFEISEEKLQERLSDLCRELQCAMPDNLLVVSPGAMALETPEGKKILESLIKEAKAVRGRLDVLMLDPRRNAMGGDENQSEILTAWGNNVDELRTKHNLAIVIVHHKGKSTTGAGRGSSVFDGWLGTMLWLEPTKTNAYGNLDSGGQLDLTQVRLPIVGRDSEQRELCLEFSYPTWRLTEKQAKEELTRVDEAANFIAARVEAQVETPLADLRRSAMKEGHSDYAFKSAVKRLVSEGVVEEVQDSSKQGNHKKVRRMSPL
jgi:hypothetical protein